MPNDRQSRTPAPSAPPQNDATVSLRLVQPVWLRPSVLTVRGASLQLPLSGCRDAIGHWQAQKVRHRWPRASGKRSSPSRRGLCIGNQCSWLSRCIVAHLQGAGQGAWGCRLALLFPPPPAICSRILQVHITAGAAWAEDRLISR